MTSASPARPAAPITPLLSLLRLVSPALPIGAYAGSEGLEYAVHAGWVSSPDTALTWLGGRLRHGVSRLDVPVLARLYDAWAREGPGEGFSGDRAAVSRWSAFLLAARETRELVAQERALGFALSRLLVDLGVEDAAWIHAHADSTYVAAFALAARRWGIALDTAAEGYLYAWSEAQVAAAVKLVPLGQTQGQRLLGELLAAIPACASRGLALDDDALGFSEPGLAIASALHESQYSRLFRS